MNLQSTPSHPHFMYEGTSFSGADMIATITIPMLTNDTANGLKIAVSKPITIGSLQTLSLSTSRAKAPVFALGRVMNKGFTRSIRTVAGTILFAMFDHEALTEAQGAVRDFYKQAHLNYNQAYGNPGYPNIIPYFKADELPPFDITVTMANEEGQAAYCKILGVEILESGTVMGISENYLEQEMRYMAQDYEPLTPGFATSGR